MISATALIVAGDSPFAWGGRYLTGDFGEILHEDVEMVRWGDVEAHDGIVAKATTIPPGAETWEQEIEPAQEMVKAPLPPEAPGATREIYEGPWDDAPASIDVAEAQFWTSRPKLATFARWPARAGFDGSVAYAHELGLLIPEDAESYTQAHPVENPDYNPEIVNVPRSERPEEWSCVGLLGQVHVRVDRDHAPDELRTNGLRCMEMRTPFDAAKGYGVAFCYLNAGAGLA